jgi:hypothetical protein
MLHNRLIRHSESAACGMAPIGGVKAYRVLMKGPASTAESEKALRIEIWEHENEDVQREVRERRDTVVGCHFGHFGHLRFRLRISQLA